MPGIVGAERPYSVKTTTSSTSGPRLNKRGYAFGSITNPTSVDRTITWYGVRITNNTAYAVKDQDNIAVTQIVTALTMADMHSAVAGVPLAVPVTSTGASTANLDFVFYR
jgi:hypothetical protein